MELNQQDIELFKQKFQAIKELGWVPNRRPGNDGGVGNTLEDYLEIVENNLGLPDFGEWELKSQRSRTTSLLTLFHREPEPRSVRFVPSIALPLYGWPHAEAGTRHPITERSFRATLNNNYSVRGLRVGIDRDRQQIFVEFNASQVSDAYSQWKAEVKASVGLDDFNPRPFWSFETLENILENKIKNLLYFRVETKKEGDQEFYKYSNFEAYINPSLENFLRLINEGSIYVDFDARTGHNHGTKFRIKPNKKKELYSALVEI